MVFAAITIAIAVTGALPASSLAPRQTAPGYCSSPGLTPPQMLAVPSTHRTYPPDAVRKGEEGSTVLDYRINELGKVEDVRISSSSGFPELDNASKASVLTEAFVPASSQGNPVACRRLERMVWKLNDSPSTMPFLNFVQMRPEDFPAQAKAKKEQGAVFVAVMIDENGKIASTIILHSSGFGDLDAASLDRIYADHNIQPAKLEGKAVSSTAIFEFCWSLDGSAIAPPPSAP